MQTKLMFFSVSKLEMQKNSIFYALQFLLIVENAPVYRQLEHRIVGFVYERATRMSSLTLNRF